MSQLHRLAKVLAKIDAIFEFQLQKICQLNILIILNDLING